MHVIGACR